VQSGDFFLQKRQINTDVSSVSVCYIHHIWLKFVPEKSSTIYRVACFLDRSTEYDQQRNDVYNGNDDTRNRVDSHGHMHPTGARLGEHHTCRRRRRLVKVAGVERGDSRRQSGELVRVGAGRQQSRIQSTRRQSRSRVGEFRAYFRKFETQKKERVEDIYWWAPFPRTSACQIVADGHGELSLREAVQ
jgi:hypothetical protein